jgi:esterase
MELFRHTLGEGPPLLILHGLFGISDNWMTIGKVLSDTHRVIIPDLRNHGRSPHAEAFGFIPMCDDLLELLEELNLLKVSLMGHSMGGKLAMHFAMHYPEMVDKLVVVDISPGQTRVRQNHLKILQAMKSVNFDLVETRQEVDRILAGFVPSESIRLFILKNLVRVDRHRLAWRINLHAIELNLDEIMEGVPAASPFRNQTLFIRGGESDYILDEDIKLISELFPGYRLKTIPNAGHWVHADQPEQFIAEAQEFLK